MSRLLVWRKIIFGELLFICRFMSIISSCERNTIANFLCYVATAFHEIIHKIIHEHSLLACHHSFIHSFWNVPLFDAILNDIITGKLVRIQYEMKTKEIQQFCIIFTVHKRYCIVFSFWTYELNCSHVYNESFATFFPKDSVFCTDFLVAKRDCCSAI